MALCKVCGTLKIACPSCGLPYCNDCDKCDGCGYQMFRDPASVPVPRPDTQLGKRAKLGHWRTGGEQAIHIKNEKKRPDVRLSRGPGSGPKERNR